MYKHSYTHIFADNVLLVLPAVVECWLGRGQLQREVELYPVAAYVQQEAWPGRGFVEPAAAVVGTSVGLPAVDAGTESDPAVTAESAEQPLNK